MKKIEVAKSNEGQRTNGRLSPQPQTQTPQMLGENLQQLLGNRAVGRLAIQRKITVNTVNNKYKQDVDGVTRQIVRQLNPPRSVQRQVARKVAQRQKENEEELMSSYPLDYSSSYNEGSAGMTSSEAPMSIAAPQQTISDAELKTSLPDDETSNYDETIAGITDADAPMSHVVPQQARQRSESHLDDIGSIPNFERLSGAKQYGDAVKIAADRMAYERQKTKNARQIMQEYKSGQITAEVAEQKAIKSRRELMSKTRARLPGPEPALTLNKKAAYRNLKAPYRDPLGWRSASELRAHKAKMNQSVTTADIIKSSGKPNYRVTGLAMLGGIMGALGGILGVQDFHDQLAGRTPVTLKGLNAHDFDVGHEFHNVSLGSGICGTIRVERNIFFRKRFYIVEVQALA